ncbi:MAG: hypothetical protein CML22_07185 [Rheinheimera sp.]|nr:hypothetical protein [Rheinheimera sp.]MBM34067.1 hypothetical protein [Rheinheimera sp.]
MENNTLTIKLASDFRDYYDHVFAGSWQEADATYERVSTSGLARPEMLSMMESINLKVPLHGTVTELREKLLGQLSYLGSSRLVDDYMRELMHVVVYLEPNAHRGEGKIKLSLTEAMQRYPGHYATQFIPANGGRLGESLRYLRVGRRQFWLRYSSKDDWRSNVGDVNIEFLCEERPKSNEDMMRLSEPLLAVDFVKADGLYAIDYNIAPGLSGTGLEKVLTSSDILVELQTWFAAR